MRCDEFMLLLSSYPDALEGEQTEFRLHAAECEACAQCLIAHETLLSSLAQLDDEIEIPEEFSAGWRTAVHTEAKQTPASNERAKHPRRMGWALRGLAAAAAAVAFICTGTALMRGGVLFPSMQRQEQLMRTAANETNITEPPLIAPMAAAPMLAPHEAAPQAGEPILMLKETAPQADMSMEAEADMEMAMEMADVQAPSDALSETSAPGPVLHSAVIGLHSQQLDVDVSRIESLLERTGGWSETWSVTGDDNGSRSARMTLRIPMSALDAFVADVSAIGQLTGCEMSIDNISNRYYDVQGRLAMYQVQRDRLTQMLEEAQTVTDMMEIREKLDTVQYTMEALVSQLNNWNSLSANALVQISVDEVTEGAQLPAASIAAVTKSAATRSLSEARLFLMDTLVFLIMAAPYIAALAVMTVLAGSLIRWLMNKKHTQ